MKGKDVTFRSSEEQMGMGLHISSGEYQSSLKFQTTKISNATYHVIQKLINHSEPSLGGPLEWAMGH